ncbi:ABC transporter permease [Azoarcus olearius]|uniref:Permease component of an ABC transporter system n=1 Tax=Azoarcus sp. (strain BH72) TaxID=418699 RepID=A1KAD8_AZOSB|nr:ABC transporter permease [Azoarcus olearius]CAL95794.1 permease component of an ABC transporter system [Azoarcus olearius]
MLATIALRNVFRHAWRTAMTLLAIVMGVASLIVGGGFVEDVFIQFGESIIHSQTGHIQVFRRDFLERGARQPERFLIERPDELATRLKGVAGVDFVAQRLNFSGLLNNGKRDLAITGEGVEQDLETRLGSYLRIIEGRALKGSDQYGILLGEGVAHSLNLKPGDRIDLLANTPQGAVNSLDFEVVGIFQSYSKDFDARAVRIPLDAAHQLVDVDGANLLVVVLGDTAATSAAHADVQKQIDPSALEARTWKDLSDFYEKTVALYERQFGVLKLIILFMVALSVVNSLNMTLMERMSEFGTARALGSRSSDLIRQILVESLIIGLLGALLGAVVGVLAAIGISWVGIPMPPAPNANIGYTAYIRVVPSAIAWAMLIGLTATVVAALFPARRIARTHIVDALRESI